MKNKYLLLCLLAMSMAFSMPACKKTNQSESADLNGETATSKAAATEAVCPSKGWSSQNGGTTGGGEVTATVVTNYTALKSAIQNTSVKEDKL
jgi:pectate lyase